MIARAYNHRSKRGSTGLLRTRFQFTLLLCFIWTGIILLKLFYIQVIQHDYYVNRANKQRNTVIALLPERGPIVDRNGRPLAISVPMTSIYGVPEAMKDLEGELKAIASIVPIEVKD